MPCSGLSDERIASSEFCATAERTKDRSPATVPTSLHFTSLHFTSTSTSTSALPLQRTAYIHCVLIQFFFKRHISVLLTSHRPLDEPETGNMDMEIGSRCLRRIDTVSETTASSSAIQTDAAVCFDYSSVVESLRG
jgi:hypothetical protein